ncbi:MAG: class A sortase [Eubacteriaceae bacterium]
MKRKIILTISIAACTFGILFACLPLILNKVLSSNSVDGIAQFDNFTSDAIQSNMLLAAEYDFDSVSDINALNLYEDIKNIDSRYIIGQIVINDIGMRLPILKGISNSNLAAGAATMKENQKMGEGNYSLAGHYNKNKHILFGGLMYIKKGCVILITDKNYIYEYVVCDMKIVYDTETFLISDQLASQKGRPVITLMTCYYSSKTGKRYFVIGEFVRKYPYDKKILI